MRELRLAIAGVGNCASALLQGIEYYAKRASDAVAGLMHPEIGPYAISSIVPVAAFDVGPARDFIEDGKNGFVVPVGDVNALADACVRAVDLEVNAIPSSAVSKLKSENICKQTLRVYESLLHNTGYSDGVQGCV